MIACEEGDIGSQGEEHEEHGSEPQVLQMLFDVDEIIGKQHEDYAGEHDEVCLEQVVGYDEADEERLQEEQLVVKSDE